MTQIATTFPPAQPKIQPEEVPFWDGLLEGEWRMPWCDGCDTYVWRPRSHCTACYQPVSGWRTLAGTGEIYSFSVVHRGDGLFADIGPYVLAWISLDGGPTVLANVTAADVSQVRIGARVVLASGVASDEGASGQRVGPVFAVA